MATKLPWLVATVKGSRECDGASAIDEPRLRCRRSGGSMSDVITVPLQYLALRRATQGTPNLRREKSANRESVVR